MIVTYLGTGNQTPPPNYTIPFETGHVAIHVHPTTTNPSCLRGPYLAVWGVNPISVQDAFDHWGENPFLPGSQNYYEAMLFQKNMQKRYAERFLKYDDPPIKRLPSKRRIMQPTLKLQFDSLHDARMRLANGCIFIGAELYYVRDVHELEGKYLLLLKGPDGKEYKIWYDSPDIDLRSPEPQYITYEDYPVYIMRSPARQQRQSINYDNLHGKRVGSLQTMNCDPRIFMKEGMSRETILWSPQLLDLMSKIKALRQLRLSRDIAIHRKDEKLMVEYRGRELGVLQEDAITVDEQDYGRPWIRRDTRMIGCNLRVAK